MILNSFVNIYNTVKMSRDFLTQTYCLASEDLEYGTIVIWSNFSFCFFWREIESS